MPPLDRKRARGTATVTNYTVMLDLDAETEYLARRNFPEAQGREQKNGAKILEIDGGPDSIRLLRMMMAEFPLAIKDPLNRWKEMTTAVDSRLEHEETILRLGRAEPPRAHFEGELRPFQQEGLDYMTRMEGRCLLADEMGLGKTVQALAFLAAHWQTAFPCVVVSPLVTLVNWKREIDKFLCGAAPRRSEQTALGVPFGGSLDDNLDAVSVQIVRHRKGAFKPADVYLINYDLASDRSKELASARPATVIFDECQNLRNRFTQKYKGCLEIAKSARYRIGLSGTPLYNRGTEILPIGEMLRPGSLPQHGMFVKTYCSYDVAQTRTEARPALSDMLRRRLMLRRRKADVLDDLPDKTLIREEIEIDDTVYDSIVRELSERTQAARERLRASAALGDGRRDDDKAGVLELNSAMAALRQGERQAAGMAKAPYAAKYVRTLLEDNPDDKFVIFCHHLAVHKALYDSLRDFGAVQVIGGQSASARQEAIDNFQGRGYNRVAVCGLRAGGLGISLTAASYVIFAELDWSPAVHRQAEDRLHRIGQKNAVFVHYLVGRETFDEKIVEKLLDKSTEINSVLSDKGEAVVPDAVAADMLARRYGNAGVQSLASNTSAGQAALSDVEKADTDPEAQAEIYNEEGWGCGGAPDD